MPVTHTQSGQNNCKLALTAYPEDNVSKYERTHTLLISCYAKLNTRFIHSSFHNTRVAKLK